MFVSFLGDIVSLSLQPGNKAISGENATLSCNTNSAKNGVYIYKTDTKNFGDAPYFTVCSDIKCLATQDGYQAITTNTSVSVIIYALDRSRDEKWWTFVTAQLTYQFYLMIYGKMALTSYFVYFYGSL